MEMQNIDPAVLMDTPPPTDDQNDDDDDVESKSPPHIWTNNKRSALLEAWPVVVKKLNEKLGTNLTGDQCRNQKNALRKLFLDFKFLQDQSGFGWDEELQTVTANKKVWAELLETHPRREFSKLKGKSFPLYDLALSVFDGTAAVGKDVGNLLPPVTTDAIKLTPAVKRKMAMEDDDKDNSDVEVNPPLSLKNTTSNAKPKRVRESKNMLIKSEMDSISGAIQAVSENSKGLMESFTQIASAISNNPKDEEHSIATPTHPVQPNQSVKEVALDLCSKKFFGIVPVDLYVEYVSVLEHEDKASTFITLDRTSNFEVCQAWLEKHVSKANQKA
ncbi:hypothetical protein PTTG_06899 [Puccinia triticina 1-1 BBBD Race 1]|uniref:Myb_DNA-bind_3 domain-containing protein n=1 Tax=Puccinia triticina (isolate 1-1 / race 1 (BBBD)) TaxID=630390 RepID=A0A180G9J1_PUCT1|nr:hypothetical protein PTTG_06899 [Puccinia triticina 1-1 BBBD Race 1]